MIETEIRSLLAAPACGTGAPTLADVEDKLTAGYARALALEAERWRLERQIAELAVALAEDVEAHSTSELADLAKRLKEADGGLSSLRVLLGSLRQRAADLRAAA
jgi:ABC-type phosphate transport system auxiliary subunit